MCSLKWQNKRDMVYRTLMVFCFLALACMLGCQQQGFFGYRKPPVYRFKTDRTPLVQRSITRLAKEANIKIRMMPAHSRPRKAAKRLTPTFITIHSTANHSPTSTAMQHSRALCRGAFTNRSWHFTVDQFMVVQNAPLHETTWHAGDAAGNNKSLGIEMCECESKGHNHFRTWDRAAKLTAILMKRYNIRLRYVVPHYHWTGKCCPAPLMTKGKPGPKWMWFLSRVDYYFRSINQGMSNR